MSPGAALNQPTPVISPPTLHRLPPAPSRGVGATQPHAGCSDQHDARALTAAIGERSARTRSDQPEHRCRERWIGFSKPDAFGGEEFKNLLFGVFAALALVLLAAMGIYGVMAAAVTPANA